MGCVGAEFKHGYVQGGPKTRPHRLMTIILSNLNRFAKKIFTGRFLSKFAVKWIFKIPPQLALISAKQAINDKLQVNVTTSVVVS